MTSYVTYKKDTHLAKESTLAIRKAPEVEKEKINPIDITKLVNIKGRSVTLETSMTSKGQVLTVLKQHQGSIVWEGETPTQVNQNIMTHKLRVNLSIPEKKTKTLNTHN